MARARQAAHNAPAVVPPQGRLTLVTGEPVMTSEQASKTTIYYTPYVGDRVPLYNGTEWENKLFSELSIAMAASANWATDKNFDVFVYNDAGTLRLVTGAAWTNDTTRAEALVRTNGIWLNNASFTGRYGASSTVSIAASRATYVGTIRTSAAGTTTWEIGGAAANGDQIRLFLWNCYNRVAATYACRDTTNSWTDAAGTWGALNASNTNRATFVRGLNEDGVWGDLSITVAPPVGNNAAVGVGLDSTAAVWTNSSCGVANASGAVNAAADSCAYSGLPGLGLHYIQAIQFSVAATATFYGDAGVTYFQEALTFNGMF